MAEGVGFEPTVGVNHGGFQDRCLKPLGHPSGCGLLAQVATEPKSGMADACRLWWTVPHRCGGRPDAIVVPARPAPAKGECGSLW